VIGGILAACSPHNVRGTALEVRRLPNSSTSAGTLAAKGGAVTVGDLRFTARNGGLESRWQPTVVRVTVMARNTSDHRVRVNMLGGNCAVRLRIYDAHEVSAQGVTTRDAAPVFNAASSAVSCYVPMLHVNLAAGDSMALASPGGGPGVSLDPGRYALAGVVTIVPGEDTLRRHGALTVEVPAGTFRVPQPYE
jgi:hypothetical protein